MTSDVIDLLEEYGALVQESVDPVELHLELGLHRHDRPTSAPGRSSRALVGAALVLIVALAATLLISRELGGDDEQTLTDGVGPAAGEWVGTASGPLEGRVGAASWSDGSRVVVLGGYRGAACPPTGSCAPDVTQPLADGAIFDPASDSWSAMSPAPVPLGHVEGVFANGNVFAITSHDGIAASMFRYEVARAIWTEVPLPSELARGSSLRLIDAEGGQLVLYAEDQSGDLAPDYLYDSAAETWSSVPRDPLAPAANRTLVWAAGRLVLVATPIDAIASGSPTYAAASLRVGDAWRDLGRSSIAFDDSTWYAVGGLVVNPSSGTISDAHGRQLSRGGQLDVESGEWSSLPNPPPHPGPDRLMPSASGDGWIVHDGQALDVESGGWLVVERPAESGGFGAGGAWVAGRFFLWGGANAGEEEMIDRGWLWAAPA